MIQKHQRYLLAFIAILVAGSIANGQDIYEWNVANGDFNVGANWDSGFVPEAAVVEQASINNGGLSFVQGSPFPTNALLIGRTSNNSGRVEIRSGGTLSVEEGTTITNEIVGGNVLVGGGGNGDGNLLIMDGGTLNTQSISSGGADTSILTIEDNGTLNVSGSSSLQRNTTIGSNVNFTTDGLTLGADQLLNVQVTGPTVMPISVTNSARLNGTLNLDFDGVTPALGDTWDIIDAGSFGGAFASITGSGSVPAGTGFVLSTVDGGDNGKLARVGLETQLVLTVDRGTGAVAIENRAAPGADVSIDGYSVFSPDNLLNVGQWDSLNAQGDADSRESNAQENHIGELSYTANRTVAGESQIELGNIYSFTPAEFQEPYPTVQWEYHLSDTNQTRVGMVEMTGPLNDLVLVVNPDTGESFIQNQSATPLTIDGYTVISNSNSLDTAGWSSLQDAGEPWRESNPAANHLGELSYGSDLDVGAFSDAIPLGSLFDTGGDRDLQFSFHMAGGEMISGVVDYGSPIDPGGQMDVCGDFDRDGDVDSADRTIQTTNWTGALPPGDPNATKTFAQGDCDADGDVDTADQNGTITNWTGAQNPAGNLVDGDHANLLYDPATGNVKLDAGDTASGVFISFVLGTGEDNMRPENLTESAPGNAGPFVDVGTNTDATTFQIGQTDPLNQGAGPVIDLGNIFPEGIRTAEELAEYLTLAEYASELGMGGTFDLIPIPEPSGFVLACFSLLGLVATRRRKRRR